MDLEHPAISRTLKEGYPDGAGKPQQKNTNLPNYNRVEEDEQMDFEEMINELFHLCADNELNFTYYSTVGEISVIDLNDDMGSDVTNGYIKDWEWEEPVDV